MRREPHDGHVAPGADRRIAAVEAVLAITFGGGGDSSSGPSGGVIVLLIIVALVGVPMLVGLVLRLRDRRRGGDVNRVDEHAANPPESGVFGGEWGRNAPSPLRRESTQQDWTIVAVIAVALALFCLLAFTI